MSLLYIDRNNSLVMGGGGGRVGLAVSSSWWTNYLHLVACYIIIYTSYEPSILTGVLHRRSYQTNLSHQNYADYVLHSYLIPGS